MKKKTKGGKWIGRWDGGRIYLDRTDGRRRYVIEKMHRTRRYTIPLDAGNEEQARAQLALFFQDPVSFDAKHRASSEPLPEGLVIDEETTQVVLDALKRAGSEAPYLRSVADHLTDWGNVFKGRPVNTVRPAEVEKILIREWKGAHHHRLMALRTFCTHYVERKRLDPRENPTLGVKVEKAAPAKLRGTKVYPMELVERFYAVVDTQHARDVLVLRCLAGIHGTEIERIGAGKCELTEVEGHPVIKGTIRFRHKGKHVQVNSLNAQMMAAAKRLVTNWAPGKNTMLKTMQRAAKRLEELAADGKPIPYLLPGNLRHCFVTWAKKFGAEVRYTGGGVPLAAIKAVVGHRSDSKVTSDVYLDEDVPPMIALPIKLTHPNDPPFEVSRLESAAVDGTPATGAA